MTCEVEAALTSRTAEPLRPDTFFSASAVMPVVQAAHRRLVFAPRLFRPVNVLDRSSATITVALSTTAFTARYVTVRPAVPSGVAAGVF
jgi:hypothetical protein